MKTAIVPSFAFAWRQFGAVLCTGIAHPVRIQCMLRRRAPHSAVSWSTSSSGSAAEMSGGWLRVGGATAPPTHNQPRSFPPQSHWLKGTLTMSCEALGVATYIGFVPEVQSLYKGQPQTGAELGSAGETHYLCCFNDNLQNR